MVPLACSAPPAATDSHSKRAWAPRLHRRPDDILGCLVIEGLAEIHQVEAALAKGRADGWLR
eukprot:scaffold16121_cov112-Isochrysis_galbana.AAC.4